MVEDVHPNLRPNPSDRAVSVLRVVGSLLPPGISGLFSELITSVIPNHREERIVKYLTALAQRLRTTESTVSELRERLGPEGLALFEDGAAAAAKATTDERIDRIARLVADGMNLDEAVAEQQREVLQLLNAVSDADVLFLARYIWRPRTKTEAMARAIATNHQPLKLDLSSMSREDGLAALEVAEDLRAVHSRRELKLAGLGLLAAEPVGKVLKEAFERQEVRVSSAGPKYHITLAGQLLLRKVGLLEWTPPPIAPGTFSDDPKKSGPGR